MAEKKDSRADQLKADRARLDEEFAAAEARMNSTQPTPTQEENDRAALGIGSLGELDDKEPDGSEEQPALRSTAPAGSAAYTTRAATPKK